MQQQQPATFQIQTCKIKIYFAFYWRVGGGGKIFSAKSLLMLPHPAKCKVNIKVQQSYSWTLSFLLMNGLNQKAIIQPLGGNSPGGYVSPHHNPTPLCFVVEFKLGFLMQSEKIRGNGSSCHALRFPLWPQMQRVALKILTTNARSSCSTKYLLATFILLLLRLKALLDLCLAGYMTELFTRSIPIQLFSMFFGTWDEQ